MPHFIHMNTSHCNANQITGFYTKYSTGLKRGNFLTIIFYDYFEHVLAAGATATMKLKLSSFKTQALSECRKKLFVK